MYTYVITRANGWANPEELKAAAAVSGRVGNEEMPDKVRWIRSYVTRHEGGRLGTVCIIKRPTRRRFESTRAALACPQTRLRRSSTPSSCGPIRRTSECPIRIVLRRGHGCLDGARSQKSSGRKSTHGCQSS